MLDRYEAESEKHFGYFPWGPMGIPLHTRGGLKKDRDPSMYSVHTFYIQDGMKKKNQNDGDSYPIQWQTKLWGTFYTHFSFILGY